MLASRIIKLNAGFKHPALLFALSNTHVNIIYLRNTNEQFDKPGKKNNKKLIKSKYCKFTLVEKTLRNGLPPQDGVTKGKSLWLRVFLSKF
ncbi:hypothetical protein [Raoultella scottii]|uniref:hypothetical protein n=1 Tax=Raoultella scottii TaxID=3040937 RepID=UPI002FA7E247